jgi:hypothetical protein
VNAQYFKGIDGAAIKIDDGWGSESEHDGIYDNWLYEKEVDDADTDLRRDTGSIDGDCY